MNFIGLSRLKVSLVILIEYDKIGSVKQHNGLTSVLVSVRDRTLLAAILVPFMCASGLHYLFTAEAIHF